MAATWATNSELAKNAPFTVRDGATFLGTVQINQEVPPNDFSAAGVNWEYLGAVYTISGTTLVVQLSNAADDIVVADAVRIERVVDPADAPTWNYKYNNLFHVIEETDPRAFVTTTQYTSRYQPWGATKGSGFNSAIEA